MSIELHALRRVAVTEEANNAFATDVTGSATYLDVPLQEGSATLTLSRPQLETSLLQQEIDGISLHVLGPKRATLAFTMPLAPTGVSAGDGNPSPAADDSALLQILATTFGGFDGSNDGTDVASSTDANTYTLTSGAGFDDGGGLAWADSAATLHAVELQQIVGAAVVGKVDLTATPTAADVIYAASTVYPAANPDTSLQMIVEGAEEDDRWLLMGGQLTSAPTITRVNGEIPTIAFSFEFADWAAEPSAAITTATYSNFTPIYTQGFVRIKAASTSVSTRTVICPAKVEYKLNSPVYAPVSCPSGTNTISRWRRIRATPFVEVSITIPYEDLTYFTARDSRTVYHIEDQIGTAAGGIVFITTPAAQLRDVQHVDEGGLAYQRLTFHADVDEYVATSTDALARSAMRIHFL